MHYFFVLTVRKNIFCEYNLKYIRKKVTNKKEVGYQKNTQYQKIGYQKKDSLPKEGRFSKKDPNQKKVWFKEEIIL